MSDELKRHPNPPLDPEKGDLEVNPQPIVSTKAANETTITEEKNNVIVKEVAVVPASPSSPPKAKHKVSRWIRWQLWFNTYR